LAEFVAPGFSPIAPARLVFFANLQPDEITIKSNTATPAVFGKADMLSIPLLFRTNSRA